MNKSPLDELSKLENEFNKSTSLKSEIEDTELEKHRIKLGFDRLKTYARNMNRQGRSITRAEIAMYQDMLGKEQHFEAAGKVEEYLIKYYKDHEDEHNFENLPKISQIEAAIKKEYTMKFNEVSGRIEVINNKTNKVDEANENSVWRRLEKQGVKCNPGYIKNLMNSDFVPNYNPFKTYFNKLEEWDKTTDHIANLSNYITADDQEFFNLQFKKMLVRCIACALTPYINRTIFVFISPEQEIGKSTFIRFLSPFRDGDEDKYYTESHLATDNKDSYIRLSENFIYNLEELASLNGANINALKAIISTGAVKERRAFGAFENSMMRRCNFFASANQDQILQDDVNTRWLCFVVKNIDFAYSEKIDINKVWAQAHYLFKHGLRGKSKESDSEDVQQFDYELTAEEKIKRELRNEDFEKSTPERDLIIKLFKPADPHKNHFYTNTEIIGRMYGEIVGQGTKLYQTNTSKELKKLGFTEGNIRINGKKSRGWYVLIVNSEIGEDRQTEDEFNESNGEVNNNGIPF